MSRSTTPASIPPEDIVIRRMTFDFPDTLDPVFVVDCPEESFVYLGLSLVLPYLEPYLIRSMATALKEIDDPTLAAQMKRFNAQEGQHYRQHRIYNEAVGMLDVPAVKAIEETIAADFKRFTASRSLRFNLAYAEGFEAATAALGLAAQGSGLFERMTPHSADIWRWHIIEELEHRTVAFDVYERLVGEYAYRCLIAAYAQLHLAWTAARTARALAKAHPDRLPGGRIASGRRLLRFGGKLARHFAPRLLCSYLPGYSPHRIRVPDALLEHARRYTARAVGVR